MTKHAKLSYIKSVWRIAGYAHLLYVPSHPKAIWGSAILLLIAELVGIWEEVGQ